MGILPRLELRFKTNRGSRKGFPTKDLLRTPRVKKSKVSIPKTQVGKSSGSYFEKPICAKCGRKHDGKCLVRIGNCYGCGKSGHMKRDIL